MLLQELKLSVNYYHLMGYMLMQKNVFIKHLKNLRICMRLRKGKLNRAKENPNI